MIVKFLAKSKTFKGVRYNANKVEKDKGQLMKVSGFGLLQGLSQLMPQDYINYLQMVSARNKRTIYPQLHAVISAKGKDTSKEELTEIADRWMKQMGYADQPYLVIFHKDTRNHHVHIVSTRIDKTSGKKISSAYEKLRAMTAINKVMKQDEKQMAKADLEKALSYNFQTKSQFMMILESKGYILREKDGKLNLIKFGKNLLEVDMAFFKERKSGYKVNQARASQITALLHKYREIYSPQLRPVTTPLPGDFEMGQHGYTSDLIEEFRRMFGIQLVFHGSPGQAPYGYTVLDHDKGNVFKGGEIMDKDELLAGLPRVAELKADNSEQRWAELDELNRIIEAEIKSGKRHGEDPAGVLTGSCDQRFVISPAQQINNSEAQQINKERSFEPFDQPIQILISDDIDDEQIHGRNRHRKRQARTNTR